MVFNIHQQVFDENGEYLEKEEQRYLDQLVELFEASPEAQVLQNEGTEPRWIGMLFDYAIRYLEVTPAQMTASDLRELLFDLVPRKISAPAEDAPEIIREMQMFWTFAGREFHLGNAEACLKILDDKAVRLLRKEMGNSANFGFAKSFVMQGQERGFDMSNQEDLDEWMLIYNTELAHKTSLPFSFPEPWIAPIATAGDREPGRHKTPGEKAKRKMAKHSRKQNRKR